MITIRDRNTIPIKRFSFGKT